MEANDQEKSENSHQSPLLARASLNSLSKKIVKPKLGKLKGRQYTKEDRKIQQSLKQFPLIDLNPKDNLPIEPKANILQEEEKSSKKQVDTPPSVESNTLHESFQLVPQKPMHFNQLSLNLMNKQQHIKLNPDTGLEVCISKGGMPLYIYINQIIATTEDFYSKKSQQMQKLKHLQKSSLTSLNHEPQKDSKEYKNQANKK